MAAAATKDEVAEARRLRQSGATLKQIASFLGRSVNWVFENTHGCQVQPEPETNKVEIA